MKRMTKKIGKHYTFHDCDIICDKCFGGCKVSQRVIDKYGELEDLLEKELGTVDLELTKGVFDEWHSYLQFAGERNAFERMLGDEYDLDRLRELKQADDEGRCVVLPCKIFDKLWNVAAHYQFEVTEIDLLPYGNILFRCGNKGTDDYAAFYGDDLGDTFTFEEPQERDNCVMKEAALRREQDE